MNAVFPARRHFDRRFYLGAGLVAAGLVFWGFAPTYYLKLLFGSPALSTRLHIHGAIMSSWLVLFFVQACLISARRVDLHRRLGLAGVVIAILVVIMGSTTTFNAAAREVGRHSEEATARVTVLGLELVQMALFAALVAAAIWMRRRPDFHKRLMLLGTACMMPSAFSRIPANLTFMVSNMLSILILFNLFVVVSALIDTLRNGRLHPAFGWGGLLAIGGLDLAYVGAITPQWIRLGSGWVSS
jgi:MFS family permease